MTLFFAVLWLSFVGYVCGACSSGYSSRNSKTISNPYNSLRSSTVQQLFNGVSPCAGSVCNTCLQPLNYATETKRFTSKFAVTGHPGFVAVLDKIFTDVANENPSLLNRITTAGVVCCRLVRRASGGCGSSYSNHAYGMSIDIKIDGILDTHGDGCVMDALYDLHPFMLRQKLYWGRDFSTEDAMHWEVSDTLGKEWLQNGFPTMGGNNVPDPVVTPRPTPMPRPNVPSAICGNGIVEPGEQCDSAAGCCENCFLLSQGAFCRPAIGDCDLPEVCDGSSHACPNVNRVENNGVPCGQRGQCLEDLTCDGVQPFCVAPYRLLPTGSSCNDNNPATENDQCTDSGYCQGSLPKAPIVETGCQQTGCEDYNPCTKDICGAHGGCEHVALEASIASTIVCRPSSGDCDEEERCVGGQTSCPADRVSASSKLCRLAMRGPCDADEYCDGQTRFCPFDSPKAAGTTCDGSGEGSDECSKSAQCVGFDCVPGETDSSKAGCGCTSPAACNDGNSCTYDACINGVCLYNRAPLDAPCDDMFFHTANDKCSKSGMCVGVSSGNNDNPYTQPPAICASFDPSCNQLLFTTANIIFYSPSENQLPLILGLSLGLGIPFVILCCLVLAMVVYKIRNNNKQQSPFIKDALSTIEMSERTANAFPANTNGKNNRSRSHSKRKKSRTKVDLPIPSGARTPPDNDNNNNSNNRPHTPDSGPTTPVEDYDVVNDDLFQPIVVQKQLLEIADSYNEEYFCVLCPKSYKSESDLEQHVALRHAH